MNKPLIVHMDELPIADTETPIRISHEELKKSGITSEDLAILAVGGTGLSLIVLAGGAIATTALLVSIMTVGIWFCMSYALTFAEGKTALVTSIRRISILFTTWIGGELFHEEHVRQRTIAAGIMVVGAILIAI